MFLKTRISSYSLNFAKNLMWLTNELDGEYLHTEYIKHLTKLLKPAGYTSWFDQGWIFGYSFTALPAASSVPILMQLLQQIISLVYTTMLHNEYNSN